MSRQPRRAKPYARFFFPDENAVLTKPKIAQVSKKRKGGIALKSQWVMKTADNKTAAQIEAGVAALYALICPDCIPKVRVVFPETDDGPYHIVSKKIPIFEPLKSFSSADVEYQNFLIKNGLCEVLATSYFLEEEDFNKGNCGRAEHNKIMRVDTGRSAFGFLRKLNLVSSRMNHTAVFTITVNDIDRFPAIMDADPYYFPTKYRTLASAQGYSQSDVDGYSALNQHHTAIEKFYCTFLKIVLMPDAVYYAALNDHLDEPLLSELTAHIVLHKNEMRLALLNCNRFYAVWKTWSIEIIEKLFPKTRDIADIEKTYARFCLELMREKLCENLTGLAISMNDIATEFSKLLDACIQEKQLTMESLHLFLQKTQALINRVPADKQSICDELKENLTILKNHFNFSQNVVIVRDDSFVQVPILPEPALVKSVVEWLRDEKNKAPVLLFFNRACDQYTTDQSSYGAYFSWSSWRNRAVSEFKKFASDIASAENGDALCAAISRLLSESGEDAKSIHHYFLTGIITEFSKEFAKAHIEKQVTKNPEFAHYLQSQPKNQLSDDRILSLVPQLIKELEPTSQRLTGIDEEWLDTSHINRSGLAGKKT
ncbi:MAG: hypothetical protein A3I77_01860 [Gammaproteobacteria bacterium RIFCSPLOWO2_02_FULL_42_14]|nr:MAG: hypothetical protein A3B71_04470 [Gammaproteobacteria bacterium RIFCSPHIGHO2_02_FULL_42_43]OGT50865.1 MAG: hypothetical protein A3E54_03760 [Gammaproteobacteria bacterium RIFCSPHIGHO2_12_FULL_41_25]OGT62540.1 MAG: hypothetical protein A3I77_01860 [Gammaproteobacteria bacterium RIFCSPLOWO2_02_FULL_42_14]OGT86523.1 MAG: hypothetical protein A3G86_08380 [Gammaproteobacteria bacterium RIFCSPLOWO2_12_FULL_42_18]